MPGRRGPMCRPTNYRYGWKQFLKSIVRAGAARAEQDSNASFSDDDSDRFGRDIVAAEAERIVEVKGLGGNIATHGGSRMRIKYSLEQRTQRTEVEQRMTRPIPRLNHLM